MLTLAILSICPEKRLFFVENQPEAHCGTICNLGGGRMSGLMGTVAEGFAFGTGSAIARRAVGAASDAIFGSGSGSDSAPVEQYEQVCWAASWIIILL